MRHTIARPSPTDTAPPTPRPRPASSVRPRATTVTLDAVAASSLLPFDARAGSVAPPTLYDEECADTGTLAGAHALPDAAPAWLSPSDRPPPLSPPCLSPPPLSPPCLSPPAPSPSSLPPPAPLPAPPPSFGWPPPLRPRHPQGPATSVPPALASSSPERRAFLSAAAERGASAASAAAAQAEREHEHERAGHTARSAAPRPLPAPVPPLDLLWHDPAVVPRLRAAPLLHAPRTPSELAHPAEWLDHAESWDDNERERRAVLAAIDVAPRRALSELATCLHDAATSTLGARPLVCVEGDWVVEHDGHEVFGTWLELARLQVIDEEFRRLAAEVLERTRGQRLPLEVLANLKRRLTAALPKTSSPPLTDVLDATLERVLVEMRSSERRDVFGGLHLRAQLCAGASRGSARARAYLDVAALSQLPLAPRFPVTVLAELRPRQEYRDEETVALRVVALALRVDARS